MTVEEMKDVLDRLGIEYVSTRGEEIQGFCPGHEMRTGHKDRNPSWYINSETGAHICFSCQFKGSLPYLVVYLGVAEDFDKAKDWLSTGGELSEAFARATKKPKEIYEDIVHVSEAVLSAFTSPPISALKSRGLSEQAAKKHEIYWDSLKSNWIIPVRDPNTKALIGWQEKSYTGRYFRNQPQGMQKSISLFGYDKYESGDLILVESPLDVVRLESVGITGGVASFGTAVSDEQLALLMSVKDGRIVIAMDNDTPGSHSASDVLTRLMSRRQEAWFFNYGDLDVKDVGGMSKSEILNGMDTAIHSVRYALWESHA